MAQFWIVFFLILLAVAELYQSVKDIVLPFPIYLGLGVVLAVASNYQQLSFSQSQQVPLIEVIESKPLLPCSNSPLLVASEKVINDIET